MTTDIQEEAMKSAREWLREAEQMGGRGYLCDGQSYRDGYIAGYEAAKAETAKELEEVWEATSGKDVYDEE